MTKTPTEWPAGTVYDSPSWPCRLVQHDYATGDPLRFKGSSAKDRHWADLIFGDPPYNIGVKYADDPTGDKMTPEEYRAFTSRTLTQLVWSARPGATLWWMTPEEHADWTGAMLSNLVGPRLYRIVWEESFSQYQGDRALTKDYRFIFVHEVAHDLSGEVTFNPQDIRVPSARQLIYKDKRANSKGRVPGTTWRFNQEMNLEELAREVVDLLATIPDNGLSLADKCAKEVSLVQAALATATRVQMTPGDIWKFRRLQGTSNDRVDWHPAQLPPELLARIVKGWSNKGDTIVDAFAGSGSLAKVCRPLGRRFVGADRSPTYLTRMAEELSV